MAGSGLFLQSGFCRDKFTVLQTFGLVENVRIMRDQHSNVSRGFGFVCYAYPQSATAAIGCMQGYELNGARLYVSMSKPAKEASRYRRSTRSARELMHTWPPVCDESAFMMEHPMPTNKAFLQVEFPAMCGWPIVLTNQGQASAGSNLICPRSASRLQVNPIHKTLSI